MRRSLPLLFAAVVVAACDPQPTTGSLVVNVTGLPSGTPGSVRISGPDQFFQLVNATTTLADLAPGEYVIIRDTVTVTDNCFGVAVVRDTVVIAAGQDKSTSASYLQACGSIALSVLGLPDNVASNVRVRGPLPGSTYNQIQSASKTITGLRPGQYEVTADSLVSFLGDRFAGTPLQQTVSVTPTPTSAAANVIYAQTTGSLAITVNGLPAGNSVQSVTVTGPGGFLQRTAQSTTMRGLAAGTYNVAAANVTGMCPNSYTTTDVSQNFSVAVSATATATVNYVTAPSSPADLNLKVDKLYLMQATQNPSGTVPIIANKPALLRVFGSANQCNTARPKIRVTTSTGFSKVIDPQEDSVRLVQDDNRLTASWNDVIPANQVAVGMTVVAEMDVANEVTEADETDNRFPATGGHPIDVKNMPPVGVRLVTIIQGGLTGDPNVLIGMDFPKKVHPVSTYDVDVRATPITSSNTLQSCTSQATGAAPNGGCPSWTSVLGEVEAARIQDRDTGVPGGNRYYYGVARVNYGNGVAGVAYVPGKSGMGWDGSVASRIMAHELGHNFNRFHAPCAVSGESGYPYPNGGIGVNGWDPVDGFKLASSFSDVMGYCNNQWISDYTYGAIMNHLLNATPTLPFVASTQPQPSLLVWGRISGGDIVIEPAFEVSARPDAIAPGPHRLALQDEHGAELFGVSFAGNRIADLPGDVETFAFHVPLSVLRGRTLASLKVTANGRTATTVASGDVAADPNVTVTRVNARFARIRWDASRFPVVMVRDPATGQVMSFARGGDMMVATPNNALDLNFSNRLRSSRRYREFR